MSLNAPTIVTLRKAYTQTSLFQCYRDLNNRPMLPEAGHTTHEDAVEKVLVEYDKFRVIQDREIMSDFDRQLKLLFGDKE